jgi:hypothetical protein
MDPVYSRKECVAAMRDYYGFLVQMFMDPAYMIEPPDDGWPEITPEAMAPLNKTDEVTQLLCHLPYIKDRPYSNHPKCLPGVWFIDWPYRLNRLQAGDEHPDNLLVSSEGMEEEFDGRIPPHCVGLVHGGYFMGSEDPDVILLDTKCGVVYYMNCPARVRETAVPRGGYLVHPLEGETLAATEAENEEGDGASGEEEEDDDGNDYDVESENEDCDDENEGSEEDEIQWGPCWPVRHFFEMLKN